MQRKAGIGKLFCRVCNLSFQKSLSPLDKEVDVYCAWIDSANEVNKKGQKIGLVGGKDSDDEDDDGPRPLKFVARKKVTVVVSDSEEEYKELPNQVTLGADRKKDPFSASEKIAELGLGQAEVKKVVPSVFDPPTLDDDKGKTDKGVKTDKPAAA